MAKFEFYLILNGKAPERETFQKGLEDAYVNGILAFEYEENEILNESDSPVCKVTMLHCKERWHGAAKRFFKRNGYSYTTQKYHGLPVFG